MGSLKGLMINFLEPSIGAEELSLIEKTFDSKWIGKGKKVAELEEKFAKLFNVPSDHIVSITSCTEAIFMAMELFGFEAENEIIVPTISFIAVPSAVKKHAKIRLCDVDKDTLQVTAKDIKDNITGHTRAVFLTHYGGFSCEMEEIVNLCQENNLILLEDSACSMFTLHNNQSCGTFGDMGMWSLDAMKMITAGDGGIMYFKDKGMADEARGKAYLGLTQGSGFESSKKNGSAWWEYDVTSCERRLVMNDISASIGLVQLDRSSYLIEKRNQITEAYDQLLSDIEYVKILKDSKSDVVTPYYYTIQTPFRDRMARLLLENEVYSTFKYFPIHRMPFFKESTFLYGSKLEFKDSDYVADRTLNLPLHANMAIDDVNKISTLIKQMGLRYKWGKE